MDWTIDQAMDAWGQTPEPSNDPEWDKRICNLLRGKVDLVTVVQVLQAAKSAYHAGIDVAN